MTPGQKMVDSQGNQVALFPLSYLYVSQGEYGNYSHQGILAMDFLGWGPTGRILKCPYYAPFDCKVVYHDYYYNVWQSTQPVITPGGKRYVSFEVAHDDNPPPLGTTAEQGDLIGYTGTNGHVTGDHVHINSCSGTYKGFYTVSSGKRQLKNSTHLYDTFYVNDTVIQHSGGYKWKTYQGGITPTYKKYRFKWVLYANKLRDKNV